MKNLTPGNLFKPDQNEKEDEEDPEKFKPLEDALVFRFLDKPYHHPVQELLEEFQWRKRMMENNKFSGPYHWNMSRCRVEPERVDEENDSGHDPETENVVSFPAEPVKELC